MQPLVRRLLVLPLLAAMAIISPARSARAQPPGGGGPPGDFQMPPEIKKMMEGMKKWADAHRNTMSLQRTIQGIGELDKDPATKVTKAQAGTILPILTTWRTKKTMTDAQARTVNQEINATLNVKQIKKMATISAPDRGMGGPGGGMGGPPGMGGGPRGGGMGGPPPGMGGPGGMPKLPDPSKFGDFNPLNPDTLPFEMMRPMAKQQVDGLITALKAR